MASRKQTLCLPCATRFDNPQPEDFNYEGTHHKSYAELEYSAEHGCYICIRLRLEVEKEFGFHNTRPILESARYRVKPTNDIREMTLHFVLDFTTRFVEARFVVLEHTRYPREDFQRQLPPNTSDPACMDLARAWLNRCRKNHECQAKCHNLVQGLFPTRLLHIQRSEGESSKVCLQYPNDNAQQAQYLTLSHMWGDRKFLSLTTKNHAEFLDQIPMDSLSQTFRDALHLTSELGFEYLWIDSLCILQDDETDWKKESGNMALIYKNAACNLCASVSASTTDGLLSETRVVDPLPPLIHFDGESPRRTKVLSEINPWTWLRESPLYRRAWVLQEQILAARAIHFGPDQMHWECAESYANEVWPLGWPIALGSQSKPARGPFARRYRGARRDEEVWHITVDINHQGLSSLDQVLTWMRIIENYSSRALTYPSDRLPALAGLIAQFDQLNMTGKCVAGIWAPYWHTQLLWRQKRTFVASKPKDTPTSSAWLSAPSWSWASIDAPIHWTLYTDTLDTDDHLCSIALKQQANEPTSSLQVGGVLLELPLEECKLITNTRNTNSSTIELHFDPLSAICEYNLDSWFLHKASASDAGSITIDHRYLINNTVILPVHGHSVTISCLLLWRDLQLEEHKYRRVGIVSMRNQAVESPTPCEDLVAKIQKRVFGTESTDVFQSMDEHRWIKYEPTSIEIK